MDVDPQVLKMTVTQYNSYCDKGYDELLAKDPAYLILLKGPRYYVAKARTCFLGTLGGIKINQKTVVIDKNDLPIPGLYAVGIDVGGLHGDSYSMTYSSGAASAFAIISGRITGENTVQYVKELRG
jgi:fumarate reductase flavoprotein subunit